MGIRYCIKSTVILRSCTVRIRYAIYSQIWCGIRRVILRGNCFYFGRGRPLRFLQTSARAEVSADEENDDQRGRNADHDRDHPRIEIEVQCYVRFHT